MQYDNDKLTLMPSAANLSSVCCWLLAKVKLLRPLKIIGSILELLSASFLTIEIIWMTDDRLWWWRRFVQWLHQPQLWWDRRWEERSSSAAGWSRKVPQVVLDIQWIQHLSNGESSVHTTSIIKAFVRQWLGVAFRISLIFFIWSLMELKTYSLRMALTTAFEKGALEVNADILNVRRAVAENMKRNEKWRELDECITCRAGWCGLRLAIYVHSKVILSDCRQQLLKALTSHKTDHLAGQPQDYYRQDCRA